MRRVKRFRIRSGIVGESGILMGLHVFSLIAALLALSSQSYSSEVKVPRMSQEKAWMKTPLKYFTYKQKLYGNETSSYLGAAKNSEQVDGKKLIDKGPIVPFIPLAFNMSFDVVLAVSDGPYSMYEIIQVKLSHDRSIWFSLDSKFDGRQYLGLPENEEDQQLVMAIANGLGVKTYHAGLTQQLIKRDDKKTVYGFQYVRKDPEGQVSDRKMDLQVEVKRKYDLGQEKISLSNYPKANKRNSNGMNHSASKLFALIDIYKTTPFTAVGKIKVKQKNFNGKYVALDHPSTGIKYQSVLGIKIKSLLSQLVAGFASGTVEDRNLILDTEDEKQAVYKEVKKHGEIELQNISYVFDKVGERLELREMLVRQNEDGKVFAQYEFNPSLPDLRFGLPSKLQESRLAVSLDGYDGISENAEENKTKKVFMLGAVRTYNDVDGSSKVVEVLSGDFSKSHVYRFKKTPEWMYARPVTSFVRQDASFESLIMNHQHGNLTSGEYQSQEAVDSTELLRSVNIEWDVRTHRLSRMVVRHGKARSMDLAQEEPFGLNPGSGLGYILGGTWGSGEAATDKAVGEVCAQKISGAKFYKLSSRTFPLRQDASNFPYNVKYFDDHKAFIEGTHQMKIQFDHAIDLDKLAFGIDGMRIMAGPTHREVGITFNGLKFEVISEGDRAPKVSKTDSNSLIIHVKAKQGFGPELSRPTKGPFRQNLFNYSAYAQMDLIVVESSRGQESVKYENEHFKKFHLGFPDKMKPVVDTAPACEDYQDELVVGQDKVALMTKFEFHSFGKKEGERKARYLRKIHFAIDSKAQDQGQIVKAFELDNKGEMTFATRYKKAVNFVQLQ